MKEKVFWLWAVSLLFALIVGSAVACDDDDDDAADDDAADDDAVDDDATDDDAADDDTGDDDTSDDDAADDDAADDDATDDDAADDDAADDDTADDDTTTIFEDNFDSYTTGLPPTDPPWEIEQGASLISIEEFSKSKVQKALYIDDPTGSGAVLCHEHGSALSGTVVLSFDIWNETIDSALFAYLAGADWMDSQAQIFMGDNTLYGGLYFPVDCEVNMPIQQWYNIKIVADTAAGDYSIFVDGNSTSCVDIEFDSKMDDSTPKTTLSLSCLMTFTWIYPFNGEGQGYFDNVWLYTIP